MQLVACGTKGIYYIFKINVSLYSLIKTLHIFKWYYWGGNKTLEHLNIILSQFLAKEVKTRFFTYNAIEYLLELILYLTYRSISSISVWYVYNDIMICGK